MSAIDKQIDDLKDKIVELMKAKERKKQEKEQVMARQLKEILGDEDILEEKRLKTAERIKVMQFKVKSL